MELTSESEKRLREALGPDRELAEITTIEPVVAHRVTSTLWLERRLFHRLPAGAAPDEEETETELSRDFVHFPSGTASRLEMTGRWVPSSPQPAPFMGLQTRVAVTTDGGDQLALSVEYRTEDHVAWLGATPAERDETSAFADAAERATVYGVHAVSLAELAESTPRRDAPTQRGELSSQTLQAVRDVVEKLPSPPWHTRVHAIQTVIEGGPMLRIACALAGGHRCVVWLPR